MSRILFGGAVLPSRGRKNLTRLHKVALLSWLQQQISGMVYCWITEPLQKFNSSIDTDKHCKTNVHNFLWIIIKNFPECLAHSCAGHRTNGQNYDNNTARQILMRDIDLWLMPARENLLIQFYWDYYQSAVRLARLRQLGTCYSERGSMDWWLITWKGIYICLNCQRP